MEVRTNKQRMNMKDVDIRRISLVLFVALLVGVSSSLHAQTSCDNYRDILEGQVIKIFTSANEADYREAAFPEDLQQVAEHEIRRLDLPNEQFICDSIFATLNDGNPLPGHPYYRAVWKIKDYYLMATYSYYTDDLGNQLIEEPTVGGIFNEEFELLVLIPNM